MFVPRVAALAGLYAIHLTSLGGCLYVFAKSCLNCIINQLLDRFTMIPSIASLSSTEAATPPFDPDTATPLVLVRSMSCERPQSTNMPADNLKKHFPVFPFFKLPLELRENILILASLEHGDPWIDEPSTVIRSERTGDEISKAIRSERTTKLHPCDFIKTKHPIIFTCHQVGVEYRAALWRRLMADDNRQVDIKVKGLSMDVADQLLSCCLRPDREKLKKNLKVRLRLDFTDFRTGGFTLYQRLAAMENVCQRFELVPKVVIDEMGIDDVFDLIGPMVNRKILHETLPIDTSAYGWKTHLFTKIFEEVNHFCQRPDMFQGRFKWRGIVFH